VFMISDLSHEAIAKSSHKFVVLAIDNSSFYSFMAPIVAYVWRKHLEYRPIIIAVGDISAVVRAYIQSVSDLYIPIGTQGHIPNHTIAQVSRLYAACHPHLSRFLDSYLMISDIDMLPISFPYFHNHDEKRHFHLRNGFALGNAKQYPMCYIGGKVRYWRNMLCPHLDEHIDNLFLHQLNTTSWFYDQELAFKLISRYQTKNPGSVEAIQLNKRQDRVNGTALQLGTIDSHVLRPAFFPQNWMRIYTDTLSEILNKQQLQWVDRYVTDFQEQEFPRLFKDGSLRTPIGLIS